MDLLKGTVKQATDEYGPAGTETVASYLSEPCAKKRLPKWLRERAERAAYARTRAKNR